MFPKKALISTLIILSLQSNAAPIIYGFSSGMLPNETQESVFRGFLLALKTFKGINPDTDLKLIYSNNPSLTSPIDVAREVLKGNPKIITGFPSSFESQLAAPVLKNSGILTIFASSSNQSLAKMSPNLYSTSEDIQITNAHIASEISKKIGMDKGAIIYNPFDFFSVNQKITWEEIIKSKPGLIINFLATTQDGKLLPEQLTESKKNKFLILTMFPSKSYDIFRLFDEWEIDIPIYTNSSWYKMEYTSLKRYILKKKTSVLVVKFKHSDLEVIKMITLSYRATYNAMPTPEVFIGYDLGLIVGSIYQKSNSAQMLATDVMKSTPCFVGSPFGKVCFSGKGGFAPRETVLWDVNEN